jgi:hypothetical protein
MNNQEKARAQPNNCKEQKLRTTSRTKNGFKHKGNHQETKNNRIHKDQIRNQNPKIISRIKKQLRKQKQDERTKLQIIILNKKQNQEQRNTHKLKPTDPKNKRQ